MKSKTFHLGITDHVVSPAAWEQEAFPEARISFLSSESLSASERESVDAILVWHEKIDDQFLKAYPNAHILVRYGVGFDTINLAAVQQHGRIFCNTPDYGTEEVADTACAMILGLTRKVLQYDRECRLYSKGWQNNVQNDNHRSNRTTVGIIGIGRIGTSVINRLKAFGFKILGYDPYQPSGHEKAIGYERCLELRDLLREADVVSIHCPDNSETHGMINADFVKAMKKGAVLVNTARGGLISDLKCLYEGLRSQHLSSLGLDVLPQEPPRKEDPLIQAWLHEEDWCRGRILINPHAAYSSSEAWREMRYKAAETARLFLTKGIIRNQIKG